MKEHWRQDLVLFDLNLLGCTVECQVESVKTTTSEVKISAYSDSTTVAKQKRVAVFLLVVKEFTETELPPSVIMAFWATPSIELMVTEIVAVRAIWTRVSEDDPNPKYKIEFSYLTIIVSARNSVGTPIRSNRPAATSSVRPCVRGSQAKVNAERDADQKSEQFVHLILLFY